MDTLFLHLAADGAEAAGEGTSAAVTAVTDMAQTVAQQGTDAIVAIVPAMAGLVAIGVVVAIGIKWVRKFKSAS